jgi:hypothetical protein
MSPHYHTAEIVREVATDGGEAQDDNDSDSDNEDTEMNDNDNGTTEEQSAADNDDEMFDAAQDAEGLAQVAEMEIYETEQGSPAEIVFDSVHSGTESAWEGEVESLDVDADGNGSLVVQGRHRGEDVERTVEMDYDEERTQVWATHGNRVLMGDLLSVRLQRPAEVRESIEESIEEQADEAEDEAEDEQSEGVDEDALREQYADDDGNLDQDALSERLSGEVSPVGKSNEDLFAEVLALEQDSENEDSE